MKLRALISGFRWPSFLVVTCLGAGFVGPLSAGEPLLLRLKGAVQVDSAGVFLHQIVEPGVAVPRLKICDAPAFGKTVSLKREQVEDLVLESGADPIYTNWSGAGAVTVSRKSRIFSEPDLLALLTTQLQRDVVKERGELELHLSRPWKPIDLPVEPLSLKVIELPPAGVVGSFVLRFELLAGMESLGTWQTVLQARIWREVWVVQSPVKRGDLVAGANLARERRDLLALHDSLAEFGAGDSSLEFGEPLLAGVPVLERSVRLRPVLHRGQLADALLEEGALNVTLKVEVLEDGAPGQYIRARNPVSRHDLKVKVVNDQLVRVAF